MAASVSVVIPAYNAAEFIAGTLERVAAQTFRDLEVVIVDDGSRDATAETAEKALKALGLQGRVHRQSNKKIAAARNAGIAQSSAPLVAFLDADDIWLPRKLELCLEVFRREPATDLVCHDENIVRDGTLVSVRRYGHPLDDLYGRFLFDGNAVSTSATVVRRAKLDEVGGFREDLAFDTVEDYDLWMRLAKTSRFFFLHEILGEYRLHLGSASARAVYHHENLRSLLLDHFAALPAATRDAGRERRRLATVDRSCAKTLLDQGDAAAAGPYARRALSAAPLQWKNPAVAALWALKRLGA